MALAHRNAALWVIIRVEVLGGAVVLGRLGRGCFEGTVSLCCTEGPLGTETVMGKEL